MLSSLRQRSGQWCYNIGSTISSGCNAAVPVILPYLGSAIIGTVVAGTRLYSSLGDYRYRMDGAMMHAGFHNVTSDEYKHNPVANAVATTGMVLSATMSCLIGIPLTYIYLKNKIQKRIAITTHATTATEKKPLLEMKISPDISFSNNILLNMARLSLVFMSLANFNGGVRMAERSSIDALYQKLAVASLTVGTQFLYIYITTKDDVDNSVKSNNKIIDPMKLEKIDALIAIDTAMTAFIAVHSTLGALETIARLSKYDIPTLVEGSAVTLAGLTALTRRYCTNGAALKKNSKNEYKSPEPCGLVNLGYYPLTTATGIPDGFLTGLSATGTVLFDIENVFDVDYSLTDILFGAWGQATVVSLALLGGTAYGYATYNYNTVRQRENLALQVCGADAFQTPVVAYDIDEENAIKELKADYDSTAETVALLRSPSRFSGSMHPNSPRRTADRDIEMQSSVSMQDRRPLG